MRREKDRGSMRVTSAEVVCDDGRVNLVVMF